MVLYEAGIRNDDLLLKVSELDVTRWRTDSTVFPLSRFWDGPAGSKLELTLKRGDMEYKATVTLRDIIGPGAPDIDPAVTKIAEPAKDSPTPPAGK